MNSLECTKQSEINERLESLGNTIAVLRSTIDRLFPALSSVTTESCEEQVCKESAPVRCSCKMSSELFDMETSVSIANDHINNILERLKL